MRSAGAFPGILLLTLFLLSGCRSADQVGAATAPEGEGQIALHNGSSQAAWYAYTRRCGLRVWGEDELGPSVVVRPGQSAAWVETAGCYDLLLLTNPRVDPRFEARYERRLVVADQQTTVVIADADWGPSSAAPPSPAPMP
jgi:hypothetical protein